jgi:hypothetical protein
LVLATLHAVAGFVASPFYPLWGIMLVALNLFVIWALMHGESRQRT